MLPLFKNLTLKEALDLCPSDRKPFVSKENEKYVVCFYDDKFCLSRCPVAVFDTKEKGEKFIYNMYELDAQISEFKNVPDHIIWDDRSGH